MKILCGLEDWNRFAVDMVSTIDRERYYFLGAIILKDEKVSMDDRRNGISKKLDNLGHLHEGATHAGRQKRRF